MSKASLATQPNKALVPTGQNSAMELDQKHAEVTLVALKLTKQELERLPQIQISQGSTNVNIQINNFNCPPPEASKHKDGSRDRLNQSLHTNASASRAIEDKRYGAENLALASNPTHATQQRSHNGPGDKVKSPHSPKAQTRLVQDRPHVETTEVRHKRPATGQGSSEAAQNGSKKLGNADASAGRAQGQIRRESSQPESKEFFSRILHTDLARDEGSRRRHNSPNSTTTSPVRGSNASRRSGSRDGSTVKQPPNQDSAQTARRQPQARSEYMRRTAAERSVAITQQGRPPSTRRVEHVGSSHGHPAVTKPTHEHNVAAPKVQQNATSAEGLKSEDIENCLVDLNSKLGNFNPKRRDPAKLVLLGGALAARQLKTGERTHNIDVLLDPRAEDWHLGQIRQCMAQAGRHFRELDRPTEQPGRAGAQNRLFGSDELRAAVYGSALSGKCVYKGDHLEVYAMNTAHAFEVELRRMEGRAGACAGLGDAVAILEALTEGGKRPRSRNACRDLQHVRRGAPISYGCIRKVETHFYKRYGKQGIVNTEWFDPVWKYQDMHGRWVAFPGN